MLKGLSIFTLALVFLFITAAPIAAQEAHSSAESESAMDPKTLYFIVVVVVASVCMMLASSMAILGQSRALITAIKAISRQPNALAGIQTNLIIGLALIESLAIYVLLIALILFFVNPFTEYLV